MKTEIDFKKEVLNNLPNEINLYKDVKLRVGGRTAAAISIPELKKEIDKWEPWDLFCKLEKDLGKIEFDFENFSELEDYRITSFGVPYLLCWAGGDWEYPVYFMIYWDGKSLRGYIPTKGNTFRKDTKTAFGSEEIDDYDEADVNQTIYILSQGCPDLIKDYTEDELKRYIREAIDDPDIYLDLLHDNLEPNEDWMIEDFESRIM